jgi:enamine deaminase RidA (YjgF/YER057c/UK114 family)
MIRSGLPWMTGCGNNRVTFKFINPESMGRPRGYSNGVLAPAGGRLLFIAGQIAWDAEQRIVSADFVEQFRQALANLITVVREAGGTPDSIARVLIYVTDKAEYCARTREIGESWRALMGRHFPAMALVEVKSLLEDEAKVEIEGVAIIAEGAVVMNDE